MSNNYFQATGFVYFNNNDSNKESDFIPFNDSPRESNNFKPGSSSSPHNFNSQSTPFYYSNDQKNWKGNLKSPGKFHYYNNRSTQHVGRGKPKFLKEMKFDRKKFLHPSFTEDPWKELEKQVEMQKKSSSQNVNDCVN